MEKTKGERVHQALDTVVSRGEGGASMLLRKTCAIGCGVREIDEANIERS